MRLDGGPESLVRARLPRGARAPGQKKEEKGGRPKGHRQPRRRTGCTSETALPTLFKTTRRPQSPRRRACCKVFRLRRRGGRWVGGKWGEALERALRRRPPPFPRRRARASGEERLVPTSSRILFHLSRLMVAVPAANLLRCG